MYQVILDTISNTKKERTEEYFYKDITNFSTSCITEIRSFSNFAELYSQYDKIAMGYDEDEDASPEDMLLYYPNDKIQKYGVLAIEIKLI